MAVKNICLTASTDIKACLVAARDRLSIFRNNFISLQIFALLMMLSCGVMLWPQHAMAAKYASIVINADTGRVMYARNADATRYPASLTKIMTLYLLFEEIKSGR
ncbi:MAG: hypothetical protein ACPHOL_09015, partial [Candidatus Puniceispirillum sp.]